MSQKYIINKLIENNYMLLNELRGRKNCTLIIEKYRYFEIDNVILEEMNSRNIEVIFKKKESDK